MRNYINMGETLWYMRQVRNLFSRTASRVLRVLLAHPMREWTIKGLSQEANVSLGYTHAVITSLISAGYATRGSSYRIRVVDPIRLIRRWAAYHDYAAINTFLRYHTFERDVDTFLSRLSRLDEAEYALTVLSGAHLIAPYVRPTTIHFYISDQTDPKTVAELLDLRPVESGGNVSVVRPYDAGVFYARQTVDGLSVVNSVQLYVDLFNYPARGSEAAEKILETLANQWYSATRV
ncbi:MAG: hypothetical protein DRO73_00900 [Candidatus Thorarchaeota archaeon]|nr:MAG: hypothetical protein DRO73_00900 [Candidatus Thorarchaeota archaeon]RLI58490.1 MAG: hypothetical protein DRO93_09735 [Candidatus Thorarchaeota archaeon]